MGIFTGLVFLVGIHLSNTKIQTINIDLNDLESSKLISLTLTYTCLTFIRKLFVLKYSYEILLYNNPDSFPSWTQVCDTCVCDIESRKEIGTYMSLEQCEQKCVEISDCNAVEYWAGTSSCFKCIDPSQHYSYENENDMGYPSSVHQQGILHFCFISFSYQMI